MDASDIRIDPKFLSGKYADSDTLAKVLEVISEDLVAGGGGGGTPGAQGEPGEQGIPGEQGEPGIQGEPGEQGIPGAKGDTGEPGIQGEQGIQGEVGATGTATLDGIAKYTWTGSKAISSGASLHIGTLLTKDFDTVGTTIDTVSTAKGTIKLDARGETEQTNLGIRLRVTGTIAGGTGTDRFYQAQLRRADNTVLENINLVKASGTNVANASVYFATYFTGIDDPFVTKGLQLWVLSGDDGTVTLTSIDVNFYATAKNV